MDEKALVKAAIEARKNAYVPYSHFAVGAALLDASGKIWQGCNIENAAYTPCNCAERTAFFKAVSEGTKDFVAIAVCGGNVEEAISELCAPCGVCRQVMREFCSPEDFVVLLAKSEDEWLRLTLKDLLPLSFGPSDLEQANCVH